MLKRTSVKRERKKKEGRKGEEDGGLYVLWEAETERTRGWVGGRLAIGRRHWQSGIIKHADRKWSNSPIPPG